jgi:hypothetical protein
MMLSGGIEVHIGTGKIGRRLLVAKEDEGSDMSKRDLMLSFVHDSRE